MKQTAATSIRAYRRIQELTKQYNELAGGKWQGIMNMMPRELPVFNPPTLPYLPEDLTLQAPALKCTTPHGTDFVARNACQYQSAGEGVQPIQMLGHSMNAVSVPKGVELTYQFDTEREGDATLYTAMIPTQPNDKGDLRYSIQIDNGEPVVISLKEKYRSDFWKLSVLRGQALKHTAVKLTKGSHNFKKDRKFYVIPCV